jgi:hypothetical protein
MDMNQTQYTKREGMSNSEFLQWLQQPVINLLFNVLRETFSPVSIIEMLQMERLMLLRFMILNTEATMVDSSMDQY